MTIEQINRFYEQLGLPKNASLTELKKAFRSHAKKLHPDRNSSPNAHNEFLAFNEIFDFIIKLKKSNPGSKNWESNPGHTESIYQIWERTEREKLRQRIKAQAKMNYREYIHSENFKMNSSLATLFTHFIFFFSCLNVFVLPIYLIYTFGRNGIIMSVVLNVFMLLFTMSAVRNLHELSLKKLIRSTRYVLKTKAALSIVILLFNFFVFITIGLNTFVELHILFQSYLGVLLFTVLIMAIRNYRLKTKINYFQYYYYSMCLVPAVISFFLTLNYAFNSNSRVESYHFTSLKRTYYFLNKPKIEKTGLIQLEDNTYEKYTAIRSFSDFSQLPDSGIVHYTIADGLFGLDVLKEYNIE